MTPGPSDLRFLRGGARMRGGGGSASDNVLFYVIVVVPVILTLMLLRAVHLYRAGRVTGGFLASLKLKPLGGAAAAEKKGGLAQLVSGSCCCYPAAFFAGLMGFKGFGSSPVPGHTPYEKKVAMNEDADAGVSSVEDDDKIGHKKFRKTGMGQGMGKFGAPAAITGGLQFVGDEGEEERNKSSDEHHDASDGRMNKKTYRKTGFVPPKINPPPTGSNRSTIEDEVGVVEDFVCDHRVVWPPAGGTPSPKNLLQLPGAGHEPASRRSSKNQIPPSPRAGLQVSMASAGPSGAQARSVEEILAASEGVLRTPRRSLQTSPGMGGNGAAEEMQKLTPRRADRYNHDNRRPQVQMQRSPAGSRRGSKASVGSGRGCGGGNTTRSPLPSRRASKEAITGRSPRGSIRVEQPLSPRASINTGMMG